MIAKILGVSKSDVDIIKGHKSRDKVVVVKDVDTRGKTVDEYLAVVQSTVENAIING